MNLDIFDLAYLLGLLHRRTEEMPNDKRAPEIIEKILDELPALKQVLGTTTTHPKEVEK